MGIADETTYNRLIACYSIIYQIFKSQGNRFYANHCYVEWKNIETDYLKNSYQKTKDTQMYFIYLMNLFLRDFCDYGTNPLKSVQLSMIVLLFFAGLYFFSPNTGDTNHIFVSYLGFSSQYFLHQKPLHLVFKDFYTKIPQKEKTPLQELYQQGLPYLPIHLQKYMMKSTNLVPKTKFYIQKYLNNFLSLPFQALSTIKKISIGFIFIISVFCLLLYASLLRFLSSFILSLNVFSTLGFGEVPIKGFMRYLTIIEGFVGWFLLSIFSVSLISQIIQ